MKKHATYTPTGATEFYTVVFDQPLDNGHWVISRKEMVVLSPFAAGFREKDNHELAQREIEKRYPSARVKKVMYH